MAAESDTWFRRNLEALRAHESPAVLLGDPAWGAPYLIHALNEPERPLVWCELTPRDEGDFVLQGNKLADAVKRALVGAHGRAPLLFGYGMPFRYGLELTHFGGHLNA
jgi:hypothetical protein